MADFSSALYLGLQHLDGVLMSWKQISTGKPAALEVPYLQRQVEHALACLTGCEGASLGSSTLHLFSDLLPLLTDQGMRLYLDAGVYPIAKWGAQMARPPGALIEYFDHFAPNALEHRLRKREAIKRRPAVVINGFCPGCGRPAPVRALLRIVRARGGLLVLDDTQALGILGYHPRPWRPYGRGGGGSPAWHGIHGPDIVLISSLAKGLGVPAAVLAGNGYFVKWYEANSRTRVHCSPPSLPVVHAAANALECNFNQGDHLRQRLAMLVNRFRQGLKAMGVATTPGLFPVQTIQHSAGLDAVTVYEYLLRQNIRTVLHPARQGDGARISFLITAHHKVGEIDRALGALSDIIHHQQRQDTRLYERS